MDSIYKDVFKFYHSMNMKIITNTFNLVMCFFLTLLLGCTEKETQVEVSSVSLNTATIEMVEGETFSLVATVLPKDAEYDGVTWASSNASVASVNSGTVTALKEGTATITASAGGKSATCSVKVSAKIIAVTSISLDKASLSIQVGDTETLTATIQPDNATDKAVVWTSSEDAIASVSNGKITAHKSGKATITAKSGTCSAECEVTVSVNTESITLDKTTLSLSVGETAQLTATVKPDDATDKTVTWSSSDESVAKVDNGKVAALKSGKATITAKCGDKTAECAVTVTVPVSSITLDKSTLSLVIGESATLTAVVKPDDATDQNVTWTSSDESVAKVDNGKVTAIKSGKATVTAKCGGKTAECAVTVAVPVSSITLDKTALSLAIGETATLTATVKPDDATDKTVVWSSSDESIAKVDKGKVIALKIGSAIVTATAASFSVSCNVTVIHPDNIIYYTSTDGNIVKPFNGSAFGANIISNEYYDGLGKIVFNSSVMKIGNNAFYECKTLRSMTIPESVTSIGDNAYYYCVALGNVMLSEATLTIGKRAFYGCGNLNIKLTNKITSIGDEAFSYAFRNTITIIEIPASVKQIGESAFSFSGISKIILNDGLVSIGDDAFWASNLSEIAIPNTVTSIGYRAFGDCRLHGDINVPGSVSKIESRLFASSPVVSVTINEGTTELGSWVFEGCGKLTTVNLPSTIQNMGYYTFEDCLVLANIYLRAQIPPFISPYTDIFKGSNSEVNIWVPRASVEAYKEKWSTYKDNIKGYDF